MPIRILLVDDSAMFRDTLRVLVEAHADWQVCGEAVDGHDAIQKNRALQPHLIIMDMSMPRMTGFEAANEILREFPKVPIVLVTLFLTPQLSQEAHRIGIRGSLSKTALERLVGDIDDVLDGQEVFGPTS